MNSGKDNLGANFFYFRMNLYNYLNRVKSKSRALASFQLSHFQFFFGLCFSFNLFFAVFFSQITYGQVLKEKLGGTSSASLAPELKKNPIGFNLSYFAFSAAPRSLVLREDASWNTYHYLSLNYKVTKSDKLSLRIPFVSQSSGVDDRGQYRYQSTKNADLILTHSNYTLFDFKNGWTLGGTHYLQLPTTEASKLRKWQAGLSAWWIFENKINPQWTLTYNAKPNYFFNTQMVTPIVKDNGRTVYESNNIGKYEHYFEITRSVNTYLSPYLDFGFIHEWFGSEGALSSKAPYQGTLRLAFGTSISLNSWLRFIVGMENKTVYSDRRGKEFALFKEDGPTDSVQYNILTFITL